MTLSPAQCRAARALLNWAQEELVRHCKITKKTIADFERGATTPRQQTLAQILAALEAQGIELLNGNRPGVRLKAEMAEGDASTSGAVHPNITRAASAEKMYQSRACEPSLMVNSVASLKRFLLPAQFRHELVNFHSVFGDSCAREADWRSGVQDGRSSVVSSLEQQC